MSQVMRILGVDLLSSYVVCRSILIPNKFCLYDFQTVFESDDNEVSDL